MTPEQKTTIDGMDQYEMAKRWRFAIVGDSLMQGVAGTYFVKVFRDKGGMTPAISKQLGWGG